jgi:hypothetical protein
VTDRTLINLNLAKSKYSPGPAPKSQTLKIEAWGDDGVKYTADGVGADGKTRPVTQMGTNAQGQALSITSVYERQ